MLFLNSYTDFVLDTMDEGVIPLLKVIYVILERVDSELNRFIYEACIDI